jgi:hypothetical protein
VGVVRRKERALREQPEMDQYAQCRASATVVFLLIVTEKGDHYCFDMGRIPSAMLARVGDEVRIEAKWEPPQYRLDWTRFTLVKLGS